MESVHWINFDWGSLADYLEARREKVVIMELTTPPPCDLDMIEGRKGRREGLWVGTWNTIGRIRLWGGRWHKIVYILRFLAKKTGEQCDYVGMNTGGIGYNDEFT